ncbi:hypothetical protein SETIT_7G074900v2 [Setaria italica]|uniref:Nodulin-like domain-containing protein n=1 Tax=Setaria italica TaxID=4555 RepID=K3YDE2_SETIT|nr:hypothetical protein SETIT_7G074900v2 [Setaria italica]
MAGVGYLFGTISPVVKGVLGYNQRQVAALGVAKNLGDCVGFLAGALSAAWGCCSSARPIASSATGGCGSSSVVTRQAPALPLWMMCVLLFVGTNYSTYFNTASLSRGPTVGILKAFSSLSSAILTQIYAVMHTPDHATLIFMVAVGPALVAIGLMFVIRPVGGHHQARPSDNNNFMFIYSICLLLASYLVGVMLLQDLVQLSDSVVVLLTMVLFILVLPIAIPVTLTLLPKTEYPIEEALLSETSIPEASTSQDKEDQLEAILSKGIDVLPPSQSRKRIVEMWIFLMIREHKYPRHIALSIAQTLMAAGLFLFAMAWPGTMYIGIWDLTVKHFGAMYNFLTIANPTGSLVFSGLIVSNLNDYEAEKQAHKHHMSAWLSPQLLHGMNLLADGPLKCEGPSCFFVSSLTMSAFCIVGAGLSLIVVHRTKRVYAQLYQSVHTYFFFFLPNSL